MELKCCEGLHGEIHNIVLIIPYGIEISGSVVDYIALNVLIIPYGIEMCESQGLLETLTVLIIPYGIEMLLPYNKSILQAQF